MITIDDTNLKRIKELIDSLEKDQSLETMCTVAELKCIINTLERVEYSKYTKSDDSFYDFYRDFKGVGKSYSQTTTLGNSSSKKKVLSGNGIVGGPAITTLDSITSTNCGGVTIDPSLYKVTVTDLVTDLKADGGCSTKCDGGVSC